MRRRDRPGRFLPTVPAAPFVSDLPAGVAALVAGYQIAPRTRPREMASGKLTVRLVFRDRNTGCSIVVNWTLTQPRATELRDTLTPLFGMDENLHHRVPVARSRSHAGG